MREKKLEDYIELGAGVWLLENTFRKNGPSKKDYEKAIAKRKLCTEIYFEKGKKFAKFDKNGIKWHEEIREDPFNLYK